MSTRTFDDGFYPASRARDIAVGNGSADNKVLGEINALQTVVDAAARAQKLREEVGVSESNETEFTNTITGPIYREAVFGTEDSFESLYPGEDRRIYLTRMDRVMGYFVRLGYAIRREDQTSGSPTTFNWIINW